MNCTIEKSCLSYNFLVKFTHNLCYKLPDAMKTDESSEWNTPKETENSDGPVDRRYGNDYATGDELASGGRDNSFLRG